MLDLFRLRPFVPTAQENDQRVAVLPVIHAVAGAVVYPQLANPFAYALPIAEESSFQSVQPRHDACTRGVIPEAVQPVGQRSLTFGSLVLADFHGDYIVA